MKELIDAAQAVVDRWDSPKWKDEAPTADYIARLRTAIALTDDLHNGLSDKSWTKVRYQGVTYSFPADLPLTRVFAETMGLTDYDAPFLPAWEAIKALPRFYREGIENGGYVLVTDVLRLLPPPQEAADESGALDVKDMSQARRLITQLRGAITARNHVRVEIRNNRIWIVKGVQSFMLAYDSTDANPEEVEWYANQLRTVLAVAPAEVLGEGA